MYRWCAPVVVGVGSVCGLFGPGTVTGALAPDALDELSGLVASRRHPGVLWGHDDSGGKAELFALSESGADLGRYEVDGATARDWEDIAASPDGHLYIGDIGDNDAERDNVTIYRVAEPSAAPDGSNGDLEGTETITLRYPTGPTNAESLVVDPLTGDLLVISKTFTGDAHVYIAPAAALVDGADVTLTDVGTIAVSLATGADVSPDGGIVLVRTYGSVLAFTRPHGGSLVDAFAQPPCEAPEVTEPQGEAIAFTAAGDAYVTASEGKHQPIHRFEMAARPTTTTTTSTTIPATVSSEKQRGRPYAIGIALACAVLVAIVVTRGVRRSRP